MIDLAALKYQIACILLALCLVFSLVKLSKAQDALAACQSKPPVVQTVTVHEKCGQKVEIIYKDGNPCPDVTAVNDNSTDIATTQTAQASPCPTIPSLAVWLSGGYVEVPYIGAGVQYRDFGVDVQKSLQGWGGQARVRLMTF